MADNTRVPVAVTGDDIATDDVGGIKYQRVKVTYGVDGVAADVTAANPLPVDVTELPAAAVLADATANPTTGTLGADNAVFNGTTWDRQRAASAAAGTTGTGLAGVGLLGYDGTNFQRAKVGAGGDLAVSITNPNSALGGMYASVSPFGMLNVAMDGVALIGDTFDGSVLDTGNRWTAAGSVLPTQVQGLLSVNPAATASATSTLNSQAAFSMGTTLAFGSSITFESGTTALGNHRFFGFGTPPSVPGTAAAPLQDAVGFEVDTAGILRASVYANGTRVFTSALTMSTDGASHRYSVVVRGDVAFFYKDTFDVALATTFVGPASQVLPLRVASLNSAAVTGIPTMTMTTLGVMDQARTAQGIADGASPWRKAGVTDVTAIANSGRQGPREQWFGNALNVNTNAIQLATYTFICKPTASALTANTLMLRTSLHHLATAVKTVRIRTIRVAALMSGVIEASQIEVHRVTAAPTGTAVTGASATASLTPLDTRDPAAEVTALNTVTATSAGLLIVAGITQCSVAALHGSSGSVLVYDWRDGGQVKPITLRAGVLEGIAVGILSSAAVTPTLTVEIDFTEE